MKRSGRILLCLACGMVLSAIAQAANDPSPATPNATPGAPGQQMADIKSRIEFLKKKYGHGKNSASNFPTPGKPVPTTPAFNPTTPNHGPAKDVSTGNAQDNPYTPIATRNVFGLNPPTPAVVDTPQGPPPPKITLTGITTILGPTEALYKVSGVPQQGKPPKDESYILQEGQGQDGVVVEHIDMAKGIVTFNNNGTVQEIPLVAGVASGGSAAPSSAPSGGFQQPRPGGFGGRPNIDFNKLPPDVRARFLQRYGNSGANQSGNNFSPAGQFNNNNNYNGGVNQNTMGLSGDDQQALIAAQHAAAINNPNSPVPPSLFPPTKYDPEAQGGGGPPPP